jgi:hypothetical protein
MRGKLTGGFKCKLMILAVIELTEQGWSGIRSNLRSTSHQSAKMPLWTKQLVRSVGSGS